MTALRVKQVCRRAWHGVALLLVAILALPVGQGIRNAHANSEERELEIVVLSNRSDLVSGGDALVELRPAGLVRLDDLRIELNGRDISDAFELRPDGRYLGMVEDLRNGDNDITARLLSTSLAASITIINHSRQGPIISGGQSEPLLCATLEAGLGPSSPPGCHAPPRYDFFYKSQATGRFEPYDLASPPPAALVQETTTEEGVTVPYVVRRERGVINRGIYDVAVLLDPSSEWDHYSPPSAWNRKLHVVFAGAIGPNGHRQQVPSGELDIMTTVHLGDLPLSKGYVVATSSLLATVNNLNDVVAAETLMMLKEHVIETYGTVRHTSSSGESGGSALQRLVATNYPGLLDGILPFRSIPDIWSMVANEFMDCSLLNRYFSEAPTLWADPADRRAVQGMGAAACETWWAADQDSVDSPLNALKVLLDPGVGCTSPTKADEEAWVYDAEDNPAGARCTAQDFQSRVLGLRSPAVWSRPEREVGRGYANRPADNVGVQYGLLAFMDGAITAEQFVDLNLHIGGRDIDHVWTQHRTHADVAGLRHAYRTGRVPDLRGLDQIPIIEVRHGGSEVDAHQAVHTEMSRARLIASNGHADNLVSWHTTEYQVRDGVPGDVINNGVYQQAFVTLERWLDRIDADTAPGTPAEKVLRNKPSAARDTCFVGEVPTVCGDRLPVLADPRLVAGGPMANDVLKCRLKPIEWDEYGAMVFTNAQWRRLRAAFPTGVCDWTRLGVAQQPAEGVWLTFADRVGGRPLGPEPSSLPSPVHEHPRPVHVPGPDMTPSPEARPAPLPATGNGVWSIGLASLLLGGATWRWRRHPQSKESPP